MDGGVGNSGRNPVLGGNGGAVTVSGGDLMLTGTLTLNGGQGGDNVDPGGPGKYTEWRWRYRRRGWAVRRSRRHGIADRRIDSGSIGWEGGAGRNGGADGSTGASGSMNVSGGMFIVNGGSIIGDNGSTGSSDPIHVGGVVVDVSDTGVLRLNDNTTLANTELTIDDSGVWEAGDVAVSFIGSDGSLVVDGATATIGQLNSSDATTAASISDGDVGAALTIGTVDADSLFVGTITDASTGAGSIFKTGTGTLSLSGANSFSGGITIDGGTLSLGNSSAAGTGGISVLGSTIDYADGVNIANVIELEADTTLNTDAAVVATQSGAISEVGETFAVTKTGDGTLNLTANNTYSGGTLIEGGNVVGSRTMRHWAAVR